MHKLIRKKDEAIFIGDDIEIIISNISDENVELNIKSPSSLSVQKGEDYEIFQQVKQFNMESVYSADLEKAQRLL